jgi:predicted transcriptional regulator
MLPTDAELDILAVLWQLGSITERTVCQELGKNSYATTPKQMQLLTENGLLVRDERPWPHLYRVRAVKEPTRQASSREFLAALFQGYGRRGSAPGSARSPVGFRRRIGRDAAYWNDFENGVGSR